jgi:hypothetical protein
MADYWKKPQPTQYETFDHMDIFLVSFNSGIWFSLGRRDDGRLGVTEFFPFAGDRFPFALS